MLELAAAALASLLALGSLGGSLYLIARARAWVGEVERRLEEAPLPFGPPATLFVPVRGDFKELEPNLRALLGQVYPELQTVMAVDSRADPLFAALEGLVGELAPGRARVVAVEDRPPVPTASGKCAAHLRALEEARAESLVFVFADDDTRPRPDWVARLVAPLGDARVGVSTAYRWYLSTGGGLASHIRSAWNLVGLQIMFSAKYNFAWGGGMAMRRKDFEAWAIAQGWRRAISDDYVVTVAAKRQERPIAFVPAALAPAYEHVTRRALFEWTRRQTFMTRIYDASLWKFAAAPYLFFNGALLLGAAVLLAAAAGAGVPLWALVVGVAFVLHVPLNLLKASVFYGGVRRMLPEHADELRKLRLPFLAGSALAPFVTVWALLATRRLRRIEWRGKRYEVEGPLDVRPL